MTRGSMLLSGVFDLPSWGYVVVALVLTHITIVAVTVFLHRHQAHHALGLHPVASHFFRLWLWLTTDMKTRDWAAIASTMPNARPRKIRTARRCSASTEC